MVSGRGCLSPFERSLSVTQSLRVERAVSKQQRETTIEKCPSRAGSDWGKCLGWFTRRYFIFYVSNEYTRPRSTFTSSVNA